MIIFQSNNILYSLIFKDTTSNKLIKIKTIAFVDPTFTYAAYQNGSFYNFYQKYTPLQDNQSNLTITTDTYLLKDRPIPHGPFPYYAHPSYKDIPYKNYFDVLQQHVKKYDPFVTNITDVDVDQGKIFQPNGLNAYDVLFLFHDEYETQSEYNNLKQFVYNGGTIVFADANILFAEVSYNKSLDSISLVKGHNWKFDGKTAKDSIGERWLDENKEWMGSNFLDIPSSINLKFRYNPFNYTHTEEQYVTNPNAKILIDYQVYNIPPRSLIKFPNPTVATYEMDYGKGKIINLGIWGHTLTDNTAFLNYIDNKIIPFALSSPLINIPIITAKLSSMPNKNNTSILNLVNSSNLVSKGVVNYSLPSTITNITGKYDTNCIPPSGTVFPIGDNLVKCIAKDNSGNNTAIETFILRVEK